MVGVFRRIRYQLLNSRQAARYLRYAVGEILLVVAGILIALQINNWNEDRKQVSKEVEMLVDIKSDIQANMENLEAGIELLEVMKENNLNVIPHFEQKLPFNDSVSASLEDFWGLWDPDFRYAAFEHL